MFILKFTPNFIIAVHISSENFPLKIVYFVSATNLIMKNSSLGKKSEMVKVLKYVKFSYVNRNLRVFFCFSNFVKYR